MTDDGFYYDAYDSSVFHRLAPAVRLTDVMLAISGATTQRQLFAAMLTILKLHVSNFTLFIIVISIISNIIHYNNYAFINYFIRCVAVVLIYIITYKLYDEEPGTCTSLAH